MAWVRYLAHRLAKLDEYQRSDAQAWSMDGGDAQYNPALFHTDQQVQSLEERCLNQGILIGQSRSGHKRKLYMDASVEVGVCSGQFTTFVFVEVTSGEFHGRPISVDALRQMGVQI